MELEREVLEKGKKKDSRERVIFHRETTQCWDGMLSQASILSQR